MRVYHVEHLPECDTNKPARVPYSLFFPGPKERADYEDFRGACGGFATGYAFTGVKNPPEWFEDMEQTFHELMGPYFSAINLEIASVTGISREPGKDLVFTITSRPYSLSNIETVNIMTNFPITTEEIRGSSKIIYYPDPASLIDEETHHARQNVLFDTLELLSRCDAQELKQFTTRNHGTRNDPAFYFAPLHFGRGIVRAGNRIIETLQEDFKELAELWKQYAQELRQLQQTKKEGERATNHRRIVQTHQQYESQLEKTLIEKRILQR